jgi:quinoprotein glucose dehydrogenase
MGDSMGGGSGAALAAVAGRSAWLLFAALQFASQSCPARPAAEQAGAALDLDWPAWGGTAGGGHFSRGRQITPDNVAQLQLVWSHRSGDVREESGARGADDWSPQSSLQVTPIVVEGVLYYCTPFNRVFALDAATGEERWSYDPRIETGIDILNHCRGVSSWRSGETGFCAHRILMGTLDARLIALDAASGRPCPDFGDNGEVDTSHRLTPHHPAEYGITSPPAILGDTVITGAAVLDNIRTDAPAGVVRAYDVRSGALRWAWNPVPPGRDPLDAGGDYAPGTTNVWSVISVDEALGLVFVPTGNTSPDFFGGHRAAPAGGEPLDYYSSSVVALDGASGEVAWRFQTVHHDVWDYDVPAQPTLVDLTLGGEPVPALVQVTKTGMTFALRRDTGEPIWPVQERPAPPGAVAADYLSPTQPHPTHLPHLLPQRLDPGDAWGLTFWDRGVCRERIAALRNEGLFTPPSLAGSMHYPGSSGGNNWGSPAIDPRRGIMVAFTSRVPWYIRLKPRSACSGFAQGQLGTPYCVETDVLTSPLGVPCSAPPWGTLDAIDLVAGKRLWSVPLGTSRDLAPFPFWYLRGMPGGGAPLMTAGGLVFSGVMNEHAFRAFDLGSGEELWKTRLPTAANALPMSYTVAGRQFVVVAAGGHWSGGSPPGDYLMAFALPSPGTTRHN